MKIPPPPAAPKQQISLDLGIEIQRDVNGIEMGVLENGIPYLTQRGLALITGVHRTVIQHITQEWEDYYGAEVLGKDRISFIKQYLFSKGYNEPHLYIETKKDGTVHYAYPDIVCMAILEYYAFESRSDNAVAVENYRAFAGLGLRGFIYQSLNYTPIDKWRHYHDRVSILSDSSPPGFFTVFNEITGLIVDLINAELTVNDKTVPDISVGIAWGKYWKDNNLSATYGDRTDYEHNYPDYFPQAASNPQRPHAYPDAALPTFRYWFKEHYLPTKFPAYILKKAHLIAGGRPEVERIASLYQDRQLPAPKK